MIGSTTSVKLHPERVTKAVDKAAFKNMGHAAARVRKDAQASIERATGASEPGTPPHTHRGTYLKRAIRFAYDKQKQEAVVGTLASIIGEAGSPHEHGGEYKGGTFPKRAFMFPAMEKNHDRMAGDWAGSVG